MKLGVIGYGSRISGIIRKIGALDPDCKIKAAVDIRQDELSKLPELAGVAWYASADEMLDQGELDGVLIGTRCSLHTPMAIKVLRHGLPLYLEKPVATTMDDLTLLKQHYEASTSKVVVSFPLRLTSLVAMAKEIVQSGKIGTVEHIQAVNNVPYGRVYYQSWYRDENETGGLFLQKATHDFDYINYILEMEPVQVCAMTGKRVFKGTKPAGLTCVACDDNRTCPESTAFRTDVGSWTHCCYAEDTGNEDIGSAIIRYASGMHVNYSQNFFVQKGAGIRGARLLGYKGTLDFDFYGGRINVQMHHTDRQETYKFGSGGDHFGGDTGLVQNFIDLLHGGTEMRSPLEAGLTSALMCLKAKESAESNTFRDIRWA